ncbi:ABC transporter substrate-binding protein [Paenibacillus sp. PAMC21692]|uniref:ABC transporter substrate-binding protein n=1 Tax=Paenibacillus sp. PAMC21692 TaxID=2762320 RepID=UPI00164DEF19|nr:ABC transporter substrate-binding protein [Paenibacillus sp. PAMC21692]QNK59573.1 ABC transporter substrate-binding protein [Paenibacillus sp. PAMC21692]
MFAGSGRNVFTIVLLCFIMLAAACSSGSNGAESAATTAPPKETSEPSASPVVESEPATRVISTAKGEIEVPSNPQRVVVLYMLGDVLAFDVTPVGVSAVYSGAAFEKALADVPQLGEWFKPSQEAVLALNPDLIIVPSEETYELMKDIAPTVLLSYFDAPLEERIRQVGDVLGKEHVVNEVLEQFYEKVEASKQKLADAGLLDKTVTIVEGGNGSMGVVASKDYGRGSQIIYEYLGMKAPEKLQAEIDMATEATGMELSFEVLSEYIGDYVFRSSYEGMADLSGNTVWNSIPAVKEGRLIEIGFGLSYYNDIYSLDKQLDYIVDSLLATVQ